MIDQITIQGSSALEQLSGQPKETTRSECLRIVFLSLLQQQKIEEENGAVL